MNNISNEVGQRLRLAETNGPWQTWQFGKVAPELGKSERASLKVAPHVGKGCTPQICVRM